MHFFRLLITALLFLSLATTRVEAQCYTDHLAERNARRFPEVAAKRALLQNAINREAEGIDARQREIVRIPVVVHVVYFGPFENISDAQIQSQIDVLNADFRLQNSNAGSIPQAFQPFAADVEIEFCLATLTPDGQSTNGITRTATDWLNIGMAEAPDGSPRICYTALGGHDAWAPEHYLNIWVAGIGGGILGYGTYPGIAPPEEQGVVVDPKYFGTIGLAAFNAPHHLGRTATHEIGHYFDLQHIWGGLENICTDDDGIGDTPVQRGPFFGCPAYPQYSCGNNAMFMNYMDYTDDACMSFFTVGQKARIWATLNVARPGLLDSLACGVSGTVAAAPEHPRVYPNPVQNDLWVEWDGETPLLFELQHVSGRSAGIQQTESTGSLYQLSLNQLPAGGYFLRLWFRNAPPIQVFFIKV